ncbi:MAG: hypothetical protein F4Y03_18780 [Alphaproteobacteria bacterium]|nr:hypothetical protein [Alphaproteobacteria bacterium]
MMTELKWPGWPELPCLMLFVFCAVLLSFLLLATADEAETHGRPDQGAEARIKGGDTRRNGNAPRGKTMNELLGIGERRSARLDPGHGEVPLPDSAPVSP